MRCLQNHKIKYPGVEVLYYSVSSEWYANIMIKITQNK